MPWVLEVTSTLWVLQLLLALYLVWRFNLAWLGPRKKRGNRYSRLTAFFFLSFGVYPLYGIAKYLLTGHANILAMPSWMVYWYWFGLVFCVVSLNGVLAFDIIKLILSRGIGAEVRTWWRRAVILWIVAAAPYTAIKMYADTTTILEDHQKIDLVGLNRSSDDPIRIAHITDIQADAYTDKKRLSAYNEKVRAYQPDLVIFTGDVVSYGTTYIPVGAEALGDLAQDYPVWAVMGDHDYWAGIDTVMSAVAQQGVTILEDQVKRLQLKSDTLALAGLLNVYSRRPKPNKLKSVLEEIEEISTDARLLISHQMDRGLVRKAANHGVDLTLSGHTHGGQLALPFWWMEISGPSIETDLLSGLYTVAGIPVNVNNGLGFTLAPVRYNAPASVSILDLY
jgi:predicted MPP superfamily phosphohydrolase